MAVKQDGFYATFTFVDYDGEKSSVGPLRLNQTDALALAAFGGANPFDLQTRLVALQIGDLQHWRVGFEDFSLTTQATNQYADRENKWLCRYQDTVTKEIYHFEIPNPDKSLRHVQFRGKADFASVAWATFKSNFQLVVRAPATGNTVELLDATIVGRNI